jgi:alpha-amylase
VFYSTSFPHTYPGVDYDADSEKTAIYRIHGDGKSWAEGVDGENQNYDYLSKLDVSNPQTPRIILIILQWERM